MPANIGAARRFGPMLARGNNNFEKREGFWFEAVCCLWYPYAVVGPNSSTGTVTLSVAAPVGGITVTLASDNTTVATVPASVTVAQGQTTATFTVTTTAVASSTALTVSAVYSGVTRTATLIVLPPPALSAVSLLPAGVNGGSSSTATVTLTSAAGPGGVTVTLSSSNTAAATLPASVTVASGQTTASVTVTSIPVTAQTTVTISGVYNGVTKTAALNVYPPDLASFSISPTAPKRVWSWDITYLKTLLRGRFYYLYVVMDIFSRYVVGWMLADRECQELAKQFLCETISKHNVTPGDLTVHSDRGAPMKSLPVSQLLEKLEVTRSHSRPQPVLGSRVQDDEIQSGVSRALLRLCGGRGVLPALLRLV